MTGTEVSLKGSEALRDFALQVENTMDKELRRKARLVLKIGKRLMIGFRYKL